MTTHDSSADLKQFIEELRGFAKIAEETLHEVESDLEGKRHLFKRFVSQMFTIRGTCEQLNFPKISQIAELGEELAVKAETAQSRAHVRKCVSCLWDAMTTIKYLVEHHTEETSEEKEILINRLETMLQNLGGQRAKVSVDEIEALLKNRN